MTEENSHVLSHVLSHKRGIELVVGALFFMGAMCPKCGFGTRAVSKKWRKCKQCGERVARRELPPVTAGSEPR